MKKQVVVSALVVSMYGCGGGSDGGNTVVPETGVFVDSPVVNIGYRTESLEGVTNAQGEFEYLPGETVTFFIGDLIFPPVTATGLVTPLDLAGSQDSSDSKVVNILRLLQTLDLDGNPDNGITITETAKGSASQVDFDLSVADFAVSTAVTTLIFNGGQESAVTELVSELEAIAHFDQTLDDNFTIDMIGRTVTSTISNSACSGVPGGWTYSFTETTITLSGTDTWIEPACILDDAESISIQVANLPEYFDLPFNCTTYPVCTFDDFDKVISGTDEDGRDFMSTYTFDRENLTLTYVKSVQGTTYTEVITIQ